MVKLLACGARGPGSDYNFRHWYLLLASSNMTEIFNLLIQMKSSKQSNITNFIVLSHIWGTQDTGNCVSILRAKFS